MALLPSEKLGSPPPKPVPRSHWCGWVPHPRAALTVPWPLAGSPGCLASCCSPGCWSRDVGRAGGGAGDGGWVPPPSACAFPQGAGGGRGAVHRYRGDAAAPGLGGGSCCRVLSVHLSTKQENPFGQGAFKMPRVMQWRPAPALLLCPAASDKAITGLSLNCRDNSRSGIGIGRCQGGNIGGVGFFSFFFF